MLARYVFIYSGLLWKGQSNPRVLLFGSREWFHGKGAEDAQLDEEVGVRVRRGSLTQERYIWDVGSATRDAILLSDHKLGTTERKAGATNTVLQRSSCVSLILDGSLASCVSAVAHSVRFASWRP